MQKSVALLLATYLASPLCWSATNLSTEQAKISYSLGIRIAKSLKEQMIELNIESFNDGIKDGIRGLPPKIDDKAREEILAKFQKMLISKHKERYEKIKMDNLKISEKFLDANKKKQGIFTLQSGLQYKILKAGQGKSPTIDDSVTVNYEGRLINGTVFDSSYERNEPATFPVNAVIPGWTEALQLMKPGEIWQLFLPPELAYGERGAGPIITPNSTLIFKIELISIEPLITKKDEK